jgi:hypothetical protein
MPVEVIVARLRLFTIRIPHRITSRVITATEDLQLYSLRTKSHSVVITEHLRFYSVCELMKNKRINTNSFSKLNLKAFMMRFAYRECYVKSILYIYLTLLVEIEFCFKAVRYKLDFFKFVFL